jgi:hypothetical protein
MPEPVRCDISGQLYSSRHLSSHKRLAHGKDKLAGAPAAQNSSVTQQDGMKKIIEIYKTLSAENKERLRAQLATLEQKPS